MKLSIQWNKIVPMDVLNVEASSKAACFLTHSLRSKAKQWMSFCGYGQNGVSKICVDGCDVVSENNGSDVTNWLDLNNR